MSKIRLFGDTSGYVDISAPAVADNRNIDLPSVLDSKLDLAGGKILQIVRETDSLVRVTTSTSYTDVTGVSVTITPTFTTSAIWIIFDFHHQAYNSTNDNLSSTYQITDASNNALSGGEQYAVGTQNLTGTSLRSFRQAMFISAYDTPATTSTITYKLRFLTGDANCTTRVRGDVHTTQIFAIEVSS